MNKQKIKKIFERFQKNNPNPKIELKYRTPFQLLVAVVLSAQATDVSVNQATKDLFRIAGTPEKMLALGEAALKKKIRKIGLYNNKAKNIMAATKIIVKQHQGRVPRARETLEALPGVGRKSANIILNLAFGEPTVAVDTHVFRVSNRTKIAPSKNVIETEQILLKVIPKRLLKNAHYWLVLHGRYICKARKPLCKDCLIRDLCEYEDKECARNNLDEF